MQDLLKGIRVIYQSAIRMELEDGQTVYFDPYGIKEELHDGDVIFITHDHYDHFSPEDIAKVQKETTRIVVPEKLVDGAGKAGFAPEAVKAVAPGQAYEYAGLSFETVAAYNNRKPFHPKKSGWVGYVLEAGGIRYYVAGDTDATVEARAVKCDVAFLPIGGTYTMNAKAAAELANAIRPRMAVPIHYGCIVGKPEDAEVFQQNLSGIPCQCLMEFGNQA